ncbi:hypothetical protein [Spirosoma areae]
MLKQLVLTLSYVNGATLLIPIGIGIIHWKNLSNGLRVGWGAIVSYFLFFVLSLAMVFLWNGKNTTIISYLIAASFGGLFAVAYWLAIPSSWRRTLIAGLAFAGVGGILLEAFVFGHYQQGSQWSVPLQTVLTTLTVLIFLHYIIRQTRISLLRIPFFWISIALLISSVLGTIYDAFQQQMLASSRELFLTWLCVQLGITIFCNLLYGVGFHRAKNSVN